MLPNELLLEIFRLSATSDLCNISLASRNFCALARPFLFTSLYFQPYVLDDDVGALRCPAPEQRRQLTDKLALFASAAIAPHVVLVSVTSDLVSDAPAPFSDDTDTHTMIAALFSTMAFFSNLRLFEAQGITFTTASIDALSSLSAFSLKLNHCSLLPRLSSFRSEFPAVKLPVVDLTLEKNGSSHWSYPGRWLAVMSPDVLQGLFIHNRSELEQAEISRFPVFPHVTRLKLPLDPADLDVIPSLLATAFPSVQSLDIDCEDARFAELERYSPGLLFPHLTELQSHAGAAGFFLPLARPKSLTLHYSYAAPLLHSLATLPRECLARTTHLQLSLDDWASGNLVTEILNHFPAMESLKLELTVNDDNATGSILALVMALPSFLPSALRSLWLHADVSGGWENDEVDDAGIPDTRVLHAQLVARCPAPPGCGHSCSALPS
ncbi:hypothetical protein MIND_00581700 [Mycena indigotica]|uniref:F-box domain-containing protein n=1 Tax=Mycena indigotica TaxID=2126181 RepID=A0A8H6SR54_9AGAR|nr:uncharacterized protein MIND_00581700 [Mycena indigotica]KAF7303525.1 hypothetical protein MIND_00581700 [Mycena indigotica]